MVPPIMKTPIRITLCALALAAWLRPALADDKDSPAVAKRTGHVLVMENETTVEGDIDLSGSQYRVRRQVGEVIIAPEMVLKLCQNREEAYLFLRQHATSAIRMNACDWPVGAIRTASSSKN